MFLFGYFGHKHLLPHHICVVAQIFEELRHELDVGRYTVRLLSEQHPVTHLGLEGISSGHQS
jgi:hypothetical protein